MNPRFLSRYTIYTAGMIILACGISLNTKTDLGVSPLISMPFAISQIWHLNFAFLAFLMYAAFTLIEILLEGKSRKWTDWLQLPFSVAFSLLLQFFDELGGNSNPCRRHMVAIGFLGKPLGVNPFQVLDDRAIREAGPQQHAPVLLLLC